MSCNLFGVIPVVDNTNGTIETAFSCLLAVLLLLLLLFIIIYYYHHHQYTTIAMYR
jgi:hypothetical protein